MYETLISPFTEFEFMRRALLGTSILSLSACPVGVFLMLRRMSLAGDAMAHAILPGAAVGFLGPSVALAYIAIFPYMGLLDPPPDTDLAAWQAQVNAWRVRAWMWLGVMAILAYGSWRLMMRGVALAARRLLPPRDSESPPASNDRASD